MNRMSTSNTRNNLSPTPSAQQQVSSIETPNIVQILERFVLLYYWSSSTKDARNVCKRIVKEFNKLKLRADLYGSSASSSATTENGNHNDDNDGDKKWRDIFSRVYHQEYERRRKSQQHHGEDDDGLIANIFGESLFRKKFKV